MAKRISSSVGGGGGVNRPADVTIIQALLNKVSLASGGPAIKLQVDGRCGPKTVDAIRKFQIRHFGAGGADGRADANGRTLGKLNDFDEDGLDFPTLTSSTTLRCPHGGSVSVIVGKLPACGQTPRGVDLSTTDQFPIAGCNFANPCVCVRWISSPALVLDTRSIGMCVNSADIPQWPVVMAKLCPSSRAGRSTRSRRNFVLKLPQYKGMMPI